MRTFIILALAFLLTACGADTPPDVAKIVQALIGAAGLAAARAQAGVAARHYLEQRTKYLIGPNKSWATEKDYTHLIQRLAKEMELLGIFVTARIAVLTGNDPASPSHRDLEDAAKRYASDDTNTVANQANDNRKERKDRIAQIAWRAGAIHDKLWAGGDSTLTPTLRDDVLTYLIDRRLHAIEMLVLHDGRGADHWSVDTKTSGWRDGQLTSMFQYPWIGLSDDLKAAFQAKTIDPTTLGPDWTVGGDGLTYKDMQKLRPAAAPDWEFDPPPFPTQKPYTLHLKASVTDAASAMGRIMPPAPKIDPSFADFLDRNLLYCDVTLAAIHLEALRFSLARKEPAPAKKDDKFNAAAAHGLRLQPVIPYAGAPLPNGVMTDGADWFEGKAVPKAELQPGDHVIFWNHQFVRALLPSAWGLENSFVTRVAADGVDLMLAGHGMIEMPTMPYAKDMIATMQKAYDALIRRINRTPDPVPAFLQITSGATQPFQLINWAPFGEGFIPANASTKIKKNGCWWIRVRRDQLFDGSGHVPTMDAALAMLPGAVRILSTMKKPAAIAGNFATDYQESVYIPLSTPTSNGGWAAYFPKHKNEDDIVFVDDMILDGSLVPGFYLTGPALNPNIPVLRPKVP